MNDILGDFYKIFDLNDEALIRLVGTLEEEDLYRASVTLPNEFISRLIKIVSPKLKEKILRQQKYHEPFILVEDVNAAQVKIGEIMKRMSFI